MLSESILKKPLQVCFVSPVSCQALGGTAAYIRLLGSELSRYDKVCAVARTATNLTFSNRYELIETERTVQSDDTSFPTRIIAASAGYRPILSQVVRLIVRPQLRALARKIVLKAFQAKLAQAIPAGTNIIHFVGTGWEMLGFAALAEARRRNIGFVVTPFLHPGDWGDSDLDVEFYNASDAVLMSSDNEAEHITALGANAERLHRIVLAPAATPSGDSERFRLKYKLGNRPLILYVARKDNYKGYHALRTAMTEVVKNIPDACLVVIGADTQPPYPEVPPNSLLDLGRLEQNKEGEQLKADAFAACDLFCVPSRAEAFGIVYVEAWSYEKAVIGGPSPAVRELIQKASGGYVVETQDDKEIATVLVRMLLDETGRRRMGQAGRTAVNNYYNWPSVAAEHHRIFETVLAQPRGKALSAGYNDTSEIMKR